jgi:hypothetical protein
MNLKYALTGVAIVAASQVSYAQYSSDAFRFSQTQTGATARIKAIGGASTAVGGDLSSVSGNPAGIGFFTRSELSVTPEFNGSQVKSTYFGQNNSSSKDQVNLNNASVVFYNRLSTPRGRDKTKGWLSFNLGASYNRTNNFYQNTYYAGRNPNGSISDYYAQEANREVSKYGNFAATDNTLQAWGYNQNLIDFYTTPNQFRSNVTSATNQSQNIVTSGGQSEFSLAGGANYSNKLYIGFGIGITSLRYNKTSSFGETGTASILPATGTGTTPVSTPYSSQYFQDQITNGTGFNAKVGFIYKPVEAVRIGATYTSPTWMSVSDSYLEGLQTGFAQGATTTNSTNPGDYDLTYNIRTPMKVSGGLAVFVGKYGFISGDVEYVDYKGMHINYGDHTFYDPSSDNTDLSTLYKSTVNARVGAEAKLENFFLRGGFNYQGNPQVGIGSPTKTTSAGLGYRFGKYYVDATYQYITHNTTIYPYQFDPIYSSAVSPGANLKNTYNNAFLTLGMRF